MDMQKEHLYNVEHEILEKIQEMAIMYDTKLLGVCLLVNGGRLLRAVHSTGLWPVKEVEAVASIVMADMLEPLPEDQMPRIDVIGKPNKLS